MKSVRWCSAIAVSLLGIAVCGGEARAQADCAGSASFEATLQFQAQGDYTDFYFPSQIPSSCFGSDNTVVDGRAHSSQRVVDAHDSGTVYYCYDGLAGPPEGDPPCPSGGAMPTLLAPDTSVNMNIAPPEAGAAFYRIFLRVQYRSPPPRADVSMHYRWFDTLVDQPDGGMDADACVEPSPGSSSSPQLGMCSRCSSLGGDCPPDCCAGLACGDNGVCCVPEGGSCANTGDCCGVGLCILGTCVSDNTGPCKVLGETCSDSAECCNDISASERYAACDRPIDKYGSSSGKVDTGPRRCCIPAGGLADTVGNCCEKSGGDEPNDPLHRVRCGSYDNKTEGCSAVTLAGPTKTWWFALALVFALLRLRRRAR